MKEWTSCLSFSGKVIMVIISLPFDETQYSHWLQYKGKDFLIWFKVSSDSIHG